MSIGNKILFGAFWTNALSATQLLLNFIQLAIVARVLQPEAIGTIAIFYIIQSVAESFTATGFNKAIIQRRHIDEDVFGTAWITGIIRGFILFIIVWLLSDVFVELLNAKESLDLVQVMAIIFLLQGFRNPKILILRKNLEFRKLFFWNASGIITRFVVTVSLLFTIMPNKWALVIGVISDEAVRCILSYAFPGGSPRISWNKSTFMELFSYGKWVLAASVVAFVSRNGNKIFVSNLLGTVELGLFYVGLRLASFPILIVTPIKNVTFPAFSNVQDSPDIWRKNLISILSTIALIMMPLCSFIALYSKPFVSIILGNPQWNQVHKILGILLFASVFEAFTSIFLSLYNAIGLPKMAFYVRALNCSVIIILGYWMTQNYGLFGIANVSLISSLLSILAVFIAAPYYLKLFPRNFKRLGYIFVITCGSALLMNKISPYINLFSITDLIIASFIYSVIYLSLTWLFQKITHELFFEDIFLILNAIRIRAFKSNA